MGQVIDIAMPRNDACHPGHTSLIFTAAKSDHAFFAISSPLAGLVLLPVNLPLPCSDSPRQDTPS
jgi:hypothetical protein